MCQSQMEVLGTESCLNRGDYFLPDLEIALSQEESTLEFLEPHTGLLVFSALFVNRIEGKKK